jgi:hypothetical protein
MLAEKSNNPSTRSPTSQPATIPPPAEAARATSRTKEKESRARASKIQTPWPSDRPHSSRRRPGPRRAPRDTRRGAGRHQPLRSASYSIMRRPLLCGTAMVLALEDCAQAFMVPFEGAMGARGRSAAPARMGPVMAAPEQGDGGEGEDAGLTDPSANMKERIKPLEEELAELSAGLGTTQSFMEEFRSRFDNQTATDVLFEKYAYEELRERFGIEQELYAFIENRRQLSKSSSARILEDSDSAEEGEIGLEPEQDGEDELDLRGDGESNQFITEFLPNSSRTPNEVIMLILDNLKKPDEPYKNHGAEVFHRFSSPHSVSYRFTLEEAIEYISSDHFDLLRRWDCVNYPRPLDLSLKKDKAHQVVRLRDSKDGSWHVVKFVLSSQKGCWLLDSIIVKAT